MSGDTGPLFNHELPDTPPRQLPRANDRHRAEPTSNTPGGDDHMSTNATSDIRRSGNMANRIGGGVIALALAATAIAIGHLINSGPDIRATAEAEMNRAIVQENADFCTRFGAGPETVRFAECVAALKAVRAREVERRADPFM
jgi:hypothetical protein